MDLQVLYNFVTVAKEESFTKAANTLHITQPTLSRQIKALEQDLGVKLFLRSNYHIQLTEEGLLLKKRAEELLAMSNKIHNEFKDIDKHIVGDVYIGCGETKGIRILARIFKQLQMTYPNIRLHIYSGNADDVTERLDKGLLDFGVLIEPANLTKYKACPLPSSDIWGVVTTRDSKFAHYESITKEELINEPLICSRQAIDPALAPNSFTEWFGSSYESLNIVATFNLAYNAGLMVKEQVGYAITLDSIINTSADNDLCFIPLSPQLTSQHTVVWRKHRTFSKAAQLFLEYLIQEIE